MRKLPMEMERKTVNQIRDVYMMPLEQEVPLLLEDFTSWRCRNLIVRKLEEALSEKKLP
jgi:hypothetical protein